MTKTAAHLGQHFLHSRKAVQEMVRAARVDDETVVLEIGPGEGVLTKELLSYAKKVVAIEKDSELVLALHETFSEEIANGKLVLIEGDVRDHTPDKLPLPDEYVVAANIPYYITGEIIRMLLSSKKQPTHIALLIQKEVAQRIVASDKKESILSLSVKAYGNPKIMQTVPRGAFRPEPSVDSAIISIENISRNYFEGFSEEEFFKIVKTGFSQKRKQLGGNLKAVVDASLINAACEECGVTVKSRAEDISLFEWKCLVRNLKDSIRP